MRALVAACLLGFACLGQSQPLPIFDAHLHYSHDAWDLVPVEDVIALLRKAGVRRALVSSSGVSRSGSAQRRADRPLHAQRQPRDAA
jgi:hypothetical protein